MLCTIPYGEINRIVEPHSRLPCEQSVLILQHTKMFATHAYADNTSLSEDLIATYLSDDIT